jgi:hypothetical protein
MNNINAKSTLAIQKHSKYIAMNMYIVAIYYAISFLHIFLRSAFGGESAAERRLGCGSSHLNDPSENISVSV